jgi:beta-lactamase superfamily II metal-dependent hydrolase
MSDFSIHLLDVGAFNYGDSLLCRFGATTILIDGGTPRSDRPSDSIVLGEDVHHQPLQDQIRALLNQSGSVAKVDLLIVTHCHSDHMGCLPALVASGKLTCKWALLADPQLGYGITTDGDEPPPFDDMSPRDKLWLALREEPLFGATDEEIAAFIEDSAQEYQQYVTFVNDLKAALDSRCVIYRGPSDDESAGLTDLLQEFSETGLHVYGPAFEQLVACAERLEGRSEDLIEDAFGDDPTTLVDAYKAALETIVAADAEDSADGAAVNCQSMVLRVGNDDHKVLLTGDMQFAIPDVGQPASAAVKALLAAVNLDAPFSCVKLSHHAATNGQNKSILTTWGAKRLAISTGSNSSMHPTENTLKALEQLESHGFKWARVDMNGRCTFAIKLGQPRLTVERLELNDKTRPSERRGDEGPPEGLVVSGPTPSTSTTIVAEPGDEGVEIRVKLPHRSTRISLTVEIEPHGDGPYVHVGTRRPGDGSSRQLGDGRTLPPLLFVTDRARLAQRIGQSEADAVVSAIQAAGKPIVNARADRLLAETRKVLSRDGDLEGVVILGGYDVVPSQIVNTLPRELAELRIRDRDRLQVWGDDGYGDREGDGVPELPVSRVPDGGSSRMLWASLTAAEPAALRRERSGIRNIRRPFADAVYKGLPGRVPLYTSEPTVPNLPPFRLAGDVLYLMLHGSASDTSVFTGEDDHGDFPIALSASDVPEPCPPIVFTGCCYGALIAQTRARDAQPGEVVPSRSVSESIALTCLARGANAFIGCTGVHYSPLQAPLTYFGEPMHRGFLTHLLGGKPASRALWSAKVDYAAGIPHRPGARAEEIAYEHKILRQYTCLGLGW